MRIAALILLIASFALTGLATAQEDVPADGAAGDGAAGDGAAGDGAAGEGAEGDQQGLGNITVIRDGDTVDGVELAIRLSETTEPGPIATVLLASSATFADGLAATSALGDAALLLTPPAGPLPGRLVVELERLAADRIVLLGGESAIGPEIAAELTSIGYAVERIQGPDRVATAVAVARRFVPDARTALLVRHDGPGSAAWADSISAGPLAAELRIPILLTTAGGLSQATADYLDDAPISTIIIVGGEAAVPALVEQQLIARRMIVRRLAGTDRFNTAEQVLELRRLGPTDRVVLFAGYDEAGWQGGLASVRHAVTSRAPLYPVQAGEVDDRLRDILDAAGPVDLTCVVDAADCGAVQDSSATQLPMPTITFNPPPSSAMAEGESIRIGVDDPDRIVDGTVALNSNCQGELQYLPEGEGFVTLTLAPDREDGGDSPLVEGPLSLQPAPGTGQASGPQDPDASAGTPEPIAPDEPSPGRPPLVCTLTFTLPRRSGDADVVETVSYSVVDLRPRIRLSSFPLQAGRPLAFTDDSDGVLDEWSWRFGDGGTAAVEFPSHTYARAGCYDVGLTVTSSLAHWLTKNRFTASTSRWLAVDPSTASDTHVEVLLRDARTDEAGVPVNGGTVNVYASQADALAETSRIATATSDSRAMAVFRDLPAGTLVFAPAEQPERLIVQEVPRGQTLCFGLSIVNVGNAIVEVKRQLADSQQEPVDGADVRIMSDLTGTIKLVGEGEGRYRKDLVPAVAYEVTVVVDQVTYAGSLTVPTDADGVSTILLTEPGL